jgi:hypothetical protein
MVARGRALVREWGASVQGNTVSACVVCLPRGVGGRELSGARVGCAGLSTHTHTHTHSRARAWVR